MAGVLDAIGLVSSGLGMISFLGSELPDGPGDGGATVRIHAGVDPHIPGKEVPMAGDIYQVFGYDHYNNFLGQTDDLGFHIEDGGFTDITINQDLGRTSASRYIDLKAGYDAVCIAYVATTQPDGSQRTWLGDVGKNCSGHWGYYESGVLVGTNEKGENHYPFCTWLDGNGDKTGSVSMKIDTDHYEVKNGQLDPDKDICAGTQWSGDYWPIDKRSNTRRRPARYDNTLVVSSFPRSSAIDLCGHSNSMGPDFVALKEGAFCDMDAKRLYPLCSDDLTSDCFDLDAGELVDTRGKRTRDGPRYEKTINW